MDVSDESIQSSGATDESDGMTSYYDNHERKTWIMTTALVRLR